MKIIVFGVTNWESQAEATYQSKHLQEWYERIKKFIPQASKIFLTTGTYSNPEFNPLDCPLYQAPFIKTEPYSKNKNYFRHGFMTGIWHTLLNYSDVDLLIHCQTRNLIGEDLTPYINNFLERDEIIMAPKFSSLMGSSIDVSLVFLKPPAILFYSIGGYRQSIDTRKKVLNCEEEAFLMFQNSWYNPWNKILTIRQLDSSFVDNKTPFKITDQNYFASLPFIASKLPHCEKEYSKIWKKKNLY
jgi:hypothetical protein